MRCLYRLQGRASTILLTYLSVALCSSAIAFADTKTYNVIKDEYLVELKPSSEVGAQSLEQSEYAAVKRLPHSSLLIVKPRTAASIADRSQREIVSLKSSDSRCPELIKSGLAKSCSPNYVVSIDATPNDPKLSSLWGMGSSGIDATTAWDAGTGSTGIVVAIIDTGIDYTHQDLIDNLWINTAEVAGNNRDDDNNGYIDDIYGINAITSSGNPYDDNAHGTHVAGTIGAVGNNALGVVGVNWNVKIMGLKFLDANGSGSLGDAIEAMNYMVAMKNRGVNVKVVNNSWGGGGYSDALNSAIKRVNDAGIIFTAAAGNEANDNDANPSYPSGYDVANVVSVAAIDSNQNLAFFSNYGATTVDIAAPGVGILSTTPGNTYQSLSGTSMATPHVTGALALLFAHDSSLTPEQAIQRLYETGQERDTITGSVRTGRTVNANRLLSNLTSPLPTVPTESVCTYTAENVPYAPDTSADEAPISLIADELSYLTVALPFTFPFHGNNVTSITISPNGVVYTKKAPSSMDYNVAAYAPAHAIAALHADLLAEAAPQGVRVVTTNDRATIFWKMKHYAYRSGGDVLIRLTLFSDGRIEDHIAIEDAQVESALQSQGTIGIAGKNEASRYTAAHNSKAISSNIGVRFTPYCTGTPPDASATITSTKIRGISKEKKRTSYVERGRRATVTLLGTGTGSAPVYFAFNKRNCPLPYLATMQNGATTFTIRVPAVSSGVTTLRAEAGSKRDDAAIKHRQKSSSRRISANTLEKLCLKLTSSAVYHAQKKALNNAQIKK
jgi:subtilisin family serine protease